MPQAVLDTPIGPIGLSWTQGTLVGVDLEPGASAGVGDPVPESLRRPFQVYFADPGAGFEVPLGLAGTPFQLRVWAAIRGIPAGSTRTYGDLAAELGSAPRAVGQACRANPCPIAVPCHRVVGARGLGGFAGDTSGRRLEVKRRLLCHEGALPGNGVGA
jgi:methylated-DNA-[protein]-cysteine S-methyltransferase